MKTVFFSFSFLPFFLFLFFLPAWTFSLVAHAETLSERDFSQSSSSDEKNTSQSSGQFFNGSTPARNSPLPPLPTTSSAPSSGKPSQTSSALWIYSTRELAPLAARIAAPVFSGEPDGTNKIHHGIETAQPAKLPPIRKFLAVSPEELPDFEFPQDGAYSIALLPKVLSEYAEPIAVQGIYLAVHPDSSVSGISLKQAQNLLQGNPVFWKDSDGKQVPVHVIRTRKSSDLFEISQKTANLAANHLASENQCSLNLPDEHASSGEVPISRNLKDSNRHNPGLNQSSILYVPDDYTALSLVSEDPDALAVVSLPWVPDASIAVKFLSVDQIDCSLENLYAGRYPLARIFYLSWQASSSSGNSTDPLVLLMERIRSQAFADALLNAGFLPLTTLPEKIRKTIPVPPFKAG